MDTRLDLKLSEEQERQMYVLDEYPSEQTHFHVQGYDVAIENDSLKDNAVLQAAFAHANGHKLHLIGLLSDGGVHSHITHLFALLEMAKKRGLSRVYVHCFLDGRDVPPASGKGYVEKLVELADRHVILERGRVVWSGSSEALAADRSLWHRYLGV